MTSRISKADRGTSGAGEAGRLIAGRALVKRPGLADGPVPYFARYLNSCPPIEASNMAPEVGMTKTATPSR